MDPPNPTVDMHDCNVHKIVVMKKHGSNTENISHAVLRLGTKAQISDVKHFHLTLERRLYQQSVTGSEKKGKISINFSLASLNPPFAFILVHNLFSCRPRGIYGAGRRHSRHN